MIRHMLCTLALTTLAVPIVHASTEQGMQPPPQNAKIESSKQTAVRILPTDSRLLIAPAQHPFGQYLGTVLAFQPDTLSAGYGLWYVIEGEQENRRIIKVKEHDPTGNDTTSLVNAVFSVGSGNAKALVVLETHTPAPTSHDATYHQGRVYGLIDDQVVLLEELTQRLNGIKDQAAAQAILESSDQVPDLKQGSLLEYFVDIPLAYVDATRAERWRLASPESRRLVTHDPKNGYLHIAGDGGLPGYYVVVFNRKDALPVAVVQRYYTMISHTYFLTRKDGVWHNVSQQLVPDYDSSLTYRLPQHGTTIEVYDEEGEKLLYKLQWDKQRFHKIQR